MNGHATVFPRGGVAPPPEAPPAARRGSYLGAVQQLPPAGGTPKAVHGHAFASPRREGEAACDIGPRMGGGVDRRASLMAV